MNALPSKTELVNSITHGLGILFGLIFLPLLINRSFRYDTNAGIIGTLTYSFFYLTTFILSTLYHAAGRPALKIRLRILDHVSIYLFIAGTYTPFVLRFMFNTTGIILLILIWLFALIGSFFKLYYVNRFALVSVISYVAMGLLFLLVRKQFFADIPSATALDIYYGVFSYLTGIIFFLWRRWKYHHAIWHLFVLAAAIFHFKAVWSGVG